MRTLKYIYISIMLLLVTIQTHAQSQKIITPKKYIAYHTKDTIKIDGLDADLAWNKIKWSDPFIDIEGLVKPTYETKIKLIWDDTYFYILAKIQEPHVWADIEEDDVIIFHNNDFEVFIDPDGDSHNYYELEINALNSIWDLFLTKPYREIDNVVLNDWNATGLKKAISIDGTLNNPNDVDSGWMLEMAIPWDVFKKSYHENVIPENQYWRVNFSRVNWDFEIKDDKYHRKKMPMESICQSITGCGHHKVLSICMNQKNGVMFIFLLNK